jgi:hypothetical protein
VGESNINLASVLDITTAIVLDPVERCRPDPVPDPDLALFLVSSTALCGNSLGSSFQKCDFYMYFMLFAA